MNQNHPQVVFVYGGHPGSGAPHQIMAALWLARLGYRVLCVAQGPRQHKTVTFPIAVLKVHLIPKIESVRGRLLWHVKLFAHLLYKRFRSYRHNLFYIQGHPATAAAFLALWGVPRNRIIYHSQDFLEPGRHRVWELFERHFARRAGTVIMNEPNRARFMASYYKLKFVPTVLRTALPAAWPWPHRDENIRMRILDRVTAPPLHLEAQLVVHYGPLVKNRCGLQIAKAISMLPSKYILVITGVREGSHAQKETQAILQNAGIENRSCSFPNLEYTELQDLGASCDIGLLLYPDDGIGNYYQAPGRLSEYLRAGLSLVMPDYPNLELLNSQLKFGATCNPYDAASISFAIVNLTDAPSETLAAQREHNIECAKKYICYENEFTKLDPIISELLS
jgi:hypothetical protein